MMMEYDPRYVDVIISRWESMTGDKAVNIRDKEASRTRMLKELETYRKLRNKEQ